MKFRTKLNAGIACWLLPRLFTAIEPHRQHAHQGPHGCLGRLADRRPRQDVRGHGGRPQSTQRRGSSMPIEPDNGPWGPYCLTAWPRGVVIPTPYHLNDLYDMLLHHPTTTALSGNPGGAQISGDNRDAPR